MYGTRIFQISFATLLMALLSGCGNTGIPLGAAYADHGEYLSINADYKAFATTRARNSGQTWGWAYSERTPQAAVEAALQACNSGRSAETTLGGCVVHSIGNRNVSALSGAELEEAIRQYKADPNAR